MSVDVVEISCVKSSSHRSVVTPMDWAHRKKWVWFLLVFTSLIGREEKGIFSGNCHSLYFSLASPSTVDYMCYMPDYSLSHSWTAADAVWNVSVTKQQPSWLTAVDFCQPCTTGVTDIQQCYQQERHIGLTKKQKATYRLQSIQYWLRSYMPPHHQFHQVHLTVLQTYTCMQYTVQCFLVRWFILVLVFV